MSKQTVKIIDWHRNGVCGLGFHVAIVEEVDGDERREMLVVRFPKSADDETGNVVCAAFDLAKLDQREIRFFHNSWRGDHYSDAVDAEIAKEKPEPEDFVRRAVPGFKRSARFIKQSATE